MQTPVVVGVHDLLRRPGTRKSLLVEVGLDGLMTSTASVADETPVEVEVVLDSINEGIVLTAEFDVPWVGECRRCLGAASGSLRIELNEVFRVDPLEDMLPIEDESIDLSAAIRDATVLALPLAPLCGDDCRGPAPEDFPVQTTSPPAERPRDPRWAALDAVRFD